MVVSPVCRVVFPHAGDVDGLPTSLYLVEDRMSPQCLSLAPLPARNVKVKVKCSSVSSV